MKLKKLNKMKENISLIYSNDITERYKFLINLLKEYGINQNKKIYLYSFELNYNYYVNHLISLLSKIDYLVIVSYMNPTMTMSLELQSKKIDRDSFIDAIETVRNSNIIISSTKVFEEESYLEYIFNLEKIEPYDVVIIDDFRSFVNKTEENVDEIIKHIEKYIKKFNTEVVLFIDEDDLEKYNLENIKKSSLDENIKFIYDENNFDIKELLLVGDKNEK